LGLEYLADLTVLKVTSGVSPVVIQLSNNSHTIPTLFDGSEGDFAGATSTATVYIGTTDDSANWSFTTSVSDVTITGTNTRTVTVTAMSADTGYVDFTATRTGFPTQTTRFSLAKAKSGSNGTAAYLTNPTHDLLANSAGVVYSGEYASAATDFIILEGGTVSSGWTYYVSAISAGVAYKDADDVSARTGTGISSGAISSLPLSIASLTADSGYVDITATKIGYSNITLRFSVTRVSEALDGTSPILVNLSGPQAAIYDKDGVTPSPTSLTFTATGKNVGTGTYYYRFSVDGTTVGSVITNATGTVTSSAYSVPTSYFSTPKLAKVEISAFATMNPVLDTDTMSLVATRVGATGASAIFADLISDADVVATSAEGTGYALPTGNSLRLYSGGTQITSGVSYSGTATKNGLTLDINSTTGAIALSGASWTGNQENFTLTATYNSIAYTIDYTIAKSKAGSDAVIPDLVSESDPVFALADGTGYTLPIGNSLRLYKGGTILSSGVSYSGTATKNGLTLSINSTTGVITLTGSGNSWTSNQETFTLTATYNGVAYTVDYSIAKSRTGAAGINAVSINYTNDSLTVPQTSAGVSTWTGSGGLLEVYDGTTLLSLSSTTQSITTPSTTGYVLNITKISGDTLTEPTFSGTTTVTIGNWFGTLTTATVYRITAYVKTQNGTNVVITTDVTISPAKAGADANVYYIAVSSPVITKNSPDAATAGAHSSITIQGKQVIGSTTSNFGWVTVTANGATEATTATNTATTAVTLAPANADGKTSYTIKLYNQATVSGATLLDTEVIGVVFKGDTGAAGINAVSINYTNDSLTVPQTSAGVSTWTGSGGLLEVYDGTTLLSLSSTTQSTTTPSTTGYVLNITKISGDTLTEPTFSGTTTVTIGNWFGTLTTATVYRITAYVKTQNGTNVVITTDVTISPAKAGADANVYYIAASSPVITKNSPDAATAGAHSSITIQGKQVIGSTTSNFGWVTVTANGATEATTATNTATTAVTLAPANADGKTSYTIKLYNQATVSGATLLDTEVIGVVFKGDTGTNGARTAKLEMFTWSFLQPIVYPAGNSTYTWSTGLFTAPPTLNGWSILPGTGIAGQTLWGISVNLVNNLTTIDSTVTWNSTTPYAVGSAGDAGSIGSVIGYGATYGIVSTTWSDAIANRVVRNILTGETLTTALSTTDHLSAGDTVTLSNVTDFAATRTWTGTAWVSPGIVIDGNLLVSGTISANKITTGSITTGQNANARINIGDINFIGNITSPMHVSKISAKNAQAMISALNDKDDSVAIWAASAFAGGNAISGTWHNSAADLTAGQWQMIGILGSKYRNAAVAGEVYGTAWGTENWGGHFTSFTGTSSNNPGSVATEVSLAYSSGSLKRAILATGPVQLFGTASPLILNTSQGTAGQVLTSQGSGATPIWSDASGGSVTYSNIQTALSPTQSSTLNLGGTFRSTATSVPTSGSGIELAYFQSVGYLISGTRNSDGTISQFRPLEIFGSTISFNSTPSAPTVATSTNSTALATTAYVVARIAAEKRTAGGSATTGAGGSVVITTGLSTVEGFSAIAIDGYVSGISAVSGGNVTVTTRTAGGGSLAGSQAVRWIATGT
jgi:hypothetical protein